MLRPYCAPQAARRPAKERNSDPRQSPPPRRHVTQHRPSRAAHIRGPLYRPEVLPRRQRDPLGIDTRPYALPVLGRALCESPCRPPPLGPDARHRAGPPTVRSRVLSFVRVRAEWKACRFQEPCREPPRERSPSCSRASPHFPSGWRRPPAHEGFRKFARGNDLGAHGNACAPPHPVLPLQLFTTRQARRPERRPTTAAQSKPAERPGRRATGLPRIHSAMLAGPPASPSTSTGRMAAFFVRDAPRTGVRGTRGPGP